MRQFSIIQKLLKVHTPNLWWQSGMRQIGLFSIRFSKLFQITLGLYDLSYSRLKDPTIWKNCNHPTMSYFKYLKKYWKLIVMNSVVHIYQRFYSIPLWCSWKVVQNLPGRFCDKRSVWQCHMIAWWTEKKPQIFLTTLYMGSLSMAFILYWFKLNVYRHVTGSVNNISLRGEIRAF